MHTRVYVIETDEQVQGRSLWSPATYRYSQKLRFSSSFRSRKLYTTENNERPRMVARCSMERRAFSLREPVLISRSNAMHSSGLSSAPGRGEETI